MLRPAKLFAAAVPECSSPTISSEPALSPSCRSSRHIRHATHSSSRPPASTSPTICSNWVTMSAKAIRSTRAASTPIMMTRLRCSAGRPAARAPTTIALSPARTMSIMMISKKAVIASGVRRLAKSMPSALVEAEHAPQAQHLLAADPALVNHAHRDIENDREADIIDPVIAMDQAGDIIGRKTHEQHGEAKADE